MYKNNLKSLETDIEKADQEITNLMQNIEASQNNSKMSQNLMLSLKMKNEEDKANYYNRLNQLNKQLKDPKLLQKKLSFNRILKGITLYIKIMPSYQPLFEREM